jgi:hypothetical protein
MNPILLAVVLLLAAPQQPDPPHSQPNQQQSAEQAHEKREQARQAAIHLNELAGNIHSEADAQAFVDAVAEQFGGGQFQTWTTRSIRHRVARAEFHAVSDPAQLIPEQRIADIWNEYVRELDAPAETLVNVAEVHSLRDAMLTMSQRMWKPEGFQQLWTIPNVYAVSADGKVASGCRAVEALKLFHDMSFSFQNVESARERVQKGILVSDVNQQRQLKPTPRPHAVKSSLAASTRVNPIMLAEHSYLQAHGEPDYLRLLQRLFEELFPED